MSRRKPTPPPWTACDRDIVVTAETHGYSTPVARFDVGGASASEQRLNARIAAAAHELLAAATMLERAETAHANCSECEGEEIPELCPKCFPKFDNARLARRAAIAKARGRKS